MDTTIRNKFSCRSLSLKSTWPAIVASVILTVYPATGQAAQESSAISTNGVARNLTVESNCNPLNPGTWTTLFEWTSDNNSSSSELDVTQYYNGWKTKKFVTIAKLKDGVNRFEWTAGDPGGEYRWRVRTNVNGKWLESETAIYQVPICPVDFIRADENEVPEEVKKTVE